MLFRTVVSKTFPVLLHHFIITSHRRALVSVNKGTGGSIPREAARQEECSKWDPGAWVGSQGVGQTQWEPSF